MTSPGKVLIKIVPSNFNETAYENLYPATNKKNEHLYVDGHFGSRS